MRLDNRDQSEVLPMMPFTSDLDFENHDGKEELEDFGNQDEVVKHLAVILVQR